MSSSYDLAGLRFVASDGFTLQAGEHAAVSGLVDIGYIPSGDAAFKALLEDQVGTGSALPGFAVGGVGYPEFTLRGGTLSAIAGGYPTPFLKPATFINVDIGQLTGTGFSVPGNFVNPFVVTAITFTPTQFALADPDGNPADGQVKLQGMATFDSIPLAKQLGLRAAVEGTNYVIGDSSGFSLTGLDASVAIPTGATLGGLEVAGSVMIGYDSASKSFTIGGGVQLTSTDGGSSSSSTLENVAATLSMTVAPTGVTDLTFALGGSFNLKALKVSTLPNQPVGFSYDLSQAQYEIFGKVQVETANGEIAVNADFGSEATPGIVIKDGHLQKLDATINAGIQFKFVTLRTDEGSGLQIKYDRTLDDVEITGGLTLLIGPDGTHAQQIGASLVAPDGSAGLVIKDGKLTKLAIYLTGGFNIYGLQLSIQQAGVFWDPASNKIDISGSFSADFKVFQTTLTLGDSKNPGIEIVKGDFSIKAVKFELDNARLGAFTIKDLMVSYTATTDPQGNPSFDLVVAVDVVLFTNFEVAGEFILINGKLDTIDVDFKSLEGIPIADTGLDATEIHAKLTNLETPSLIVFTGSLTVVWGEQVMLFGKQVSLFRVTGTVTASASELIIEADAQIGAYSSDGGVTYQAALGDGDAKLTLDWAQHFYALHVSIDGLAGIFDVTGDIVFAQGKDIAFLATAEVVVPSFVPFIGGLRLGGFGFFFDHVFPHDNVASSTTVAGWINLDIIWPFTVGFQVYFDASGGESFSLIGGDAVANFKKELMPSEPSTFTYLSDFAGTIPAPATSLVASVDWSQTEPGVGISGTPTFRVRKTVVGQDPVYIDEKDFAANGISFVDKPGFNGSTKRSVQIVGSSSDPFKALGAQYALEVKFTTDSSANPFPDYPNPDAEDQLNVQAAYHVAVPSFGPTGGPQPYLPPLPTTNPTSAFPVTLSGNIDEALVGRAKVSLYRVAVNDPYQRGVLVGASGLTAISPPANGVNWTATIPVPIDNLDPAAYTLYSVLNDGSSSDPSIATMSNAPIQTGSSAAFTPSFAVQGKVANQNNDPEAGWTVFLDYNRNGVQDGNEPGTTTNADGYYGFTRTFPASTGWAPVPVNSAIVVHLVEPSGISEFAPIAPASTTFDGSKPSNVGFTPQEFSAIKGVIYADSKDTGQAADGRGVAGATVYLDLNGNGKRDPGEPTSVTDTTGHYLFANAQAGSYQVRVDQASLVDSSLHIAYVVPSNTYGSDSVTTTTYGTQFTVRRPITITQLGVFNEDANGLAQTLTTVLYDATSHAEMARLVFTNSDPGTEVGGSEFKNLAQPITLPAGFVGVIASYGYGPEQRAGNIGITAGTWTVDGGNVLSFDSSSYATSPDTYPTIPSNPASGSAWAAGTFAYQQAAWTPTSPASNLIDSTIAPGGFSLSEANNFGVLPPAYLSGTITGGSAQAASPTGGASLTSGWDAATYAAARVAAYNIGGPATGLFDADPGNSGAGTSTPSTMPIDTSQVVNPAPQAVYQTQAYGTDFTEHLGGLTPNTQYLVRLHYAESYFDAPNKRIFDVAINGNTVLTNFDIFAAAGGGDIAIVREFTATADVSGTINIRSSSSLNNAVLSGVEILRSDPTQAGWTVRLVSDVVARAPSGAEAWAINAGGPTEGVFGVDTGATGGSTSTSPHTIDTSHVNDPAPESVYQSSRFGDFTYAATGLKPNTVYTVRLHFVDYFFTTIGARQFDVAINGVPVLTNFDIVAAAGGGNIAIVRAFTASSDASGTIRFAFKNNATLAAIEIRQPGGPIAVDAGGSASGNFAADGGFVGGQPTGLTGVAVDTSKVSDPAPQEVYQTGRYGDDFTYTMSGLTPGASYAVRLHFAETNFKVAGQRKFNVAINGSQILQEFDIVAAAGGGNIAVVEPFTASANADGTIVIHFTAGSVDHANISGIEVLQPGSVVATTTTDANGRYTFTQPIPGLYTVQQIPPAGWRPVAGTFSTLSFAETQFISRIQGPIVVGDFNGDGLLDVAFANSDGRNFEFNGIGILFGGQTQPIYYQTGGDPIKLVVGDFTGHHRLDIASLNGNGQSEISLLINTGSSDLTKLFSIDNNYWPGQRQLNSENLVDFAAADLNHDGLTDLVVSYADRGATSGSGGYAVFLNGDDATRKVTLDPITASQPTGIALGDINDDGNVDILLGGAYADPAYEYYYVAYGDGHGGFAPPTLFTVNSGAFFGPVALGNIRGLGLNDAAFLDTERPNYYNVQTAANGGGGNLAYVGSIANSVTDPLAPVPQRMILADVNGDGRPDLVLLLSSRDGYTDGQDGVEIFLNTGRGSFYQASDSYWFPSVQGIATWDMALADFNGDGLPDILISARPGAETPGPPATLLINQSLQGQQGTSVRLDAGQFISGLDFDNVQTPGGSSVSGQVFNDSNRSGTRQTGEGGIGGLTVFADINHNGRYDVGEPTAVTRADGTYSLAGLPLGIIGIGVAGSPSWIASRPGSDLDQITVGDSPQQVDFALTLPLLNPVADQVATVGRPLAIAVTRAASARPGQVWRYSLDPSSPAGATIDPATGLITWTPAQGPGRFTFLARLRDALDPAQTQVIPIVVAVSEIGEGTVTIAVASSSTNSAYGQGLTFTARVSPPTAGIPEPTGSIQFEADGVPFGSVVELTNGAATSPSIATLGAGSHTITALYSGDPDFASLSSKGTPQVIAPAPLTIRADNQTKVYGQPNPTFSISTVGLVLGQSLGLLDGSLAITTQVTHTSHVGFYVAVPGGLTSPNYTITFVPGTVAVTPAPLTATAVDAIVSYGQAVPTLTARYSGFVNGDGPSNLSTPVILGTTATEGSPTGLYPITVSGASSPDYTITFVNGVLAVQPSTTTSYHPGWIAFVTTLFRDILGRAPDIVGYEYWLGRLADGTTRAEVNREFFGSAERRMLQKEHKAYKISQKAALADAIRADELASVPASKLANPGHIALVTTLYHEILNRAPEPSGRQYWLEELAVGTIPATVAMDIYNSPERKALQHQRKAPRISERIALFDALKAEAMAVRIAVATPKAPGRPSR